MLDSVQNENSENVQNALYKYKMREKKCFWTEKSGVWSKEHCVSEEGCAHTKSPSRSTGGIQGGPYHRNADPFLGFPHLRFVLIPNMTAELGSQTFFKEHSYSLHFCKSYCLIKKT